MAHMVHVQRDVTLYAVHTYVNIECEHERIAHSLLLQHYISHAITNPVLHMPAATMAVLYACCT